MEDETPNPGAESETEASVAEANESGASETEAGEAAVTEESVAASEYSPEELNDGQEKSAGKPADVNLNLVLDIPVDVSLRVGSTDISIRDLVSLVEGSVVALDQDAGDPMDVLVNGTLIAHGEIVVVDDQYGVRLTDVVSPAERIEQLH